MITRPPKIPNWLKLGTLVVMAPICVVVFFRQHDVILPLDFSSASWKSNVPARMNMFHDLLKKNIVMGKTSKELEELLGPADGEPRHEYPDTYYYRLEEGDLLKHGKYIQLVGFKTKNDRVVDMVEAVEKYW